MAARRRRSRCLVLAAGLVLAGCGDDPPPPAAAVAESTPARTAAGAGSIAIGTAAPTETRSKRLAVAPIGAISSAIGASGPLPLALAAPAATLPPIHERDLGDALVRFRVIESVRTGRSRFEYQFAVSIENQGSGLLRGTLRVASESAGTRVVVDCVSFGTTPPGTTREGDAPFVVSQDRSAGFAPETLVFSISTGSAAAPCLDPGRVTLRRLNRTEYDNTLRDLLGTTRRPARDFPADDFGYGFDTIGDVLATSPLLVEKADVAALSVAEEALAGDPPTPQVVALRALCDPAVEGIAPCSRRILGAFARRAWRRPPTAAEIETLGAIADGTAATTGGFDAGLADGMEAVLMSPHFLFRVEQDAQGRSAEAHALSDHELATRLSYFLWSSLPDAELDALADAGTLHSPATLAAQVARMIRDPKVQGFVESFSGQWLATRALDDANPDYAHFPTWGDPLREAMRGETQRFFGELMTADRSFLDLLDADFTYVNDTLAAHYGLPLPGTDELVRVTLPAGGQRGGILTHASLHTVTSHPARTSAVKRGKWILDQLLCIAIDPPPAGVETVLPNAGLHNSSSLRRSMEAHRNRPECASCHDLLDPLGLALENYGPIGAWSTSDFGGTIDASGALPDGRSFDGPRELAAILRADPSTSRCIADRLLVYALGRGLDARDAKHLDAIDAAFAAGGHRFESLLVAIVQSPPFRERRGEPSPPGAL